MGRKQGHGKSARGGSRKKQTAAISGIVAGIACIVAVLASGLGKERESYNEPESNSRYEYNETTARESTESAGFNEAESSAAYEEYIGAVIYEDSDEGNGYTGLVKPASDKTILGTASDGTVITLADVPEYSGNYYKIINDNYPFFTENEITTSYFEIYSELDSLGRCGAAFANICAKSLPTEARGDISDIHPTGWVQVQYEIVDGESLYNRSHLIAFALAGENANELNLITGTRYLNVGGMLPFESLIMDYMDENPNNHVLYRVTPIFDGDNLVASGVLMEAYSVEDEGDGIEFCVYCYNVQPGIIIDYATGESREE